VKKAFVTLIFAVSVACADDHRSFAASIQVIMDWSRTDRENAVASYDSIVKVFNQDDSIPEDGLCLVVEQAKEAAKLSKEVSTGEVAISTRQGLAKEKIEGEKLFTSNTLDL
jgi:riboflavin synthase alpha subunit